MINKYLTLFILITIIIICSCSIIHSNHNDHSYNDVYSFLFYDWSASTTAGPLLVFQDKTGDIIFVLADIVTSFDLSVLADSSYCDIRDGDIVTIELSALADNSDYVRLEENKEYHLELEEVKNIGKISTKTSNNPLEVESPNFGYTISSENSSQTILIIKNGKLNGKIFTCDQIYANYILKSAIVVND